MRKLRVRRNSLPIPLFAPLRVFIAIPLPSDFSHEVEGFGMPVVAPKDSAQGFIGQFEAADRQIAFGILYEQRKHDVFIRFLADFARRPGVSIFDQILVTVYALGKAGMRSKEERFIDLPEFQIALEMLEQFGSFLRRIAGLYEQGEPFSVGLRFPPARITGHSRHMADRAQAACGETENTERHGDHLKGAERRAGPLDASE